MLHVNKPLVCKMGGGWVKLYMGNSFHTTFNKNVQQSPIFNYRSKVAEEAEPTAAVNNPRAVRSPRGNR